MIGSRYTKQIISSDRSISKIVNESELTSNSNQIVINQEFNNVNEEISELMDCPIGTVRSRIFRARETIAEKLKPLIETSNKRW